jgi:soluble lytic murein transglycosylase
MAVARPRLSRSSRQWQPSRPRDGKLRRRAAKSKRNWGWLLLAMLSLLGVVYAWPQPEVQRYRYPLLYREDLCREARQFRIPATLMAALILTESNFEAKAISPVGARGLMQLMPDTGLWVHEHLEERSGQPDLLSPATNLHLGASYLNYLWNRFGGHEVTCLAAYNAGPQQALEWMALGSGGWLRLDEIRFSETRLYVEAVLERERIYRQLYPELWKGDTTDV